MRDPLTGKEYAKRLVITESETQVRGEPTRYRVQLDDNPGFCCDDVMMGLSLLRAWSHGTEVRNNTSTSFPIGNSGRFVPAWSTWNGGESFGEKK